MIHPTLLPIVEAESEILSQLQSVNRLVVAAPTGSGKSTGVPLILWESNSIDGQILVLQPRRLATRLVAQRVAELAGSSLGQTVGYQTRHDNQTSKRSAIIFMTEGLFLRRCQSTPKLERVGAVLLDEFHERSLAADTALGLMMQLQTSRPQLKLLVMSATLDVEGIANHLACPVVQITAQRHTVETTYRTGTARPCWELAADALAQVLGQHDDGDILIFMPGAYEIRRTIEMCQQRFGSQSIRFRALHGSLPIQQQNTAVSPSRERKVIVSTNVAETSITIENVRHVIDSGLARVHHYDPRRGINVLSVQPISQASADQRRGRAGRSSAGTCIRLWPMSQLRAPYSTPEIQRLELAECVLQLRTMGTTDLRRFPWLAAPPEAALHHADRLLLDLGATDKTGQLTEAGRQMGRLPMHPRLSRMLLEASARECLDRASLWAALISERDLLEGRSKATDARGQGVRSDMVVLEQRFEAARQARFEPQRCAELGVRYQVARDVDRTRMLFGRVCRSNGLASSGHGATSNLIKCLLIAFPDHVAWRRRAEDRSCALAGQKRVELDPQSVATGTGPLLALDVREVASAGRVKTVLSLASELDEAWLHEVHPDRISRVVQTVWDETSLQVRCVETRAFDGLVLDQTDRPQVDPDAAAEMLVQLISIGALKLETWDDHVEQWIARARCVGRWLGQQKLIAYDDDDLRLIWHDIVAGAIRYSQIRNRPCLTAVRNALSWPDQQYVEQMAPAHIRLPGGRRMKIAYQVDAPPRGRAKIQDLYDLHESPAVAAGRQKVVLEILGPNQRPLQVTEDLSRFWKDLYPQLKRQLQRRYPKHEWR